MGISDAEIEEAVQLVASVAAGVVLAAADRGREAAEHRHFYWRPPEQAGGDGQGS